MPSSVISESQNTGIDDALQQLLNISKQPTRNRSHPVEPLISEICSEALSNGVSTVQLSHLLDLIVKPSYLSQSNISSLIKNLYPNGAIDSSLVYRAISSIGQGSGKPNLQTQALLLEWLVQVRSILEDIEVLTKCYGALFNNLGIYGIQPPLCHLLATITKRKHVKPWRIQILIRHAQIANNPASILGLLRIYKDFHPDIVVDQHTAAGKPSVFRSVDSEWHARVQAIQSNVTSPEGQSVGHGILQRRRRIFRRENNTIPQTYTFHVDDNLVSLEEVDETNSLVARLESVEPPGQMISALHDELLRTYMILCQDQNHTVRVNEWLSLFFDAQLQITSETKILSKDLQIVLSGLLDYVRHVKVLPSPVMPFLRKLFQFWDGKDCQDTIIELLSFLPLQSFEDVYNDILSGIDDSIADNTAISLARLITLYASLFRNWTSLLLAGLSPPLEAFSTLSTHVSYLVLQILTVKPSPSSARNGPTTLALVSVLRYMTSVAHTISLAPTNPYIRILTPSPYSVYLLAFIAPITATISPLCSVLATYKLAFEATMSNSSSQASNPSVTPPISPYPRPYVNEFNGFLMDICNLLWRSRAFNTSDQNALGCLIPNQVTRYLQNYLENVLPSPLPLPSLFSLSFHPTLTAVSISVLREIEDRAIATAYDHESMDIDSGAGAGVTGAGLGIPGDVRQRHAGPATQRSLATLGAEGGVKVAWAEYRLEVLQWLDARGVNGVGELMYCTMKLLMGGKQQARARRD